MIHPDNLAQHCYKCSIYHFLKKSTRSKSTLCIILVNKDAVEGWCCSNKI